MLWLNNGISNFYLMPTFKQKALEALRTMENDWDNCFEDTVMTNNKGIIYQMVEKNMKEYRRDYDRSEWRLEQLFYFADALEDLLPEIQELEPVWISVEERLPRENEKVLMVHKWDEEMIVWVYKNGLVWYWIQYSNSWKIGTQVKNFTRWQSLPPTK
jgi:hypothetical protein